MAVVSGTLVPVIGLIQVGQQSIACRYMYIPAVGLAIMFVWGICMPQEQIRRHVALGAGFLIVATLAILTIHEPGIGAIPKR